MLRQGEKGYCAMHAERLLNVRASSELWQAPTQPVNIFLRLPCRQFSPVGSRLVRGHQYIRDQFSSATIRNKLTVDTRVCVILGGLTATSLVEEPCHTGGLLPRG